MKEPNLISQGADLCSAAHSPTCVPVSALSRRFHPLHQKESHHDLDDATTDEDDDDGCEPFHQRAH